MKLRVANIDDHMDMVLPLLSDLVKKDQPLWTVQDALDRCRYSIWLLVVGDEPGFAMCSVHGDELHIEVACHPNSQYTVSDYDGFWDMLAQRLHCTSIHMESKRKGWERIGWQGGWIKYHRAVKEDLYV